MVNVQRYLHRVMPGRFAKHSRSTQELLRFLISCLATSRVHQYLIIIINKIGRPRSGSPICLITRMITDRTGRHEVLLPINHDYNKFVIF